MREREREREGGEERRGEERREEKEKRREEEREKEGEESSVLIYCGFSTALVWEYSRTALEDILRAVATESVIISSILLSLLLSPPLALPLSSSSLCHALLSFLFCLTCSRNHWTLCLCCWLERLRLRVGYPYRMMKGERRRGREEKRDTGEEARR